MDIKLPKRTEDLRIDNLKCLTNPIYQTEQDINGIVDFLVDFTGYKRNTLLKIDYKDILKMYAHLTTIFTDFKVTEKPPLEITLNGKVFERVNPEKVGIGWHIDFSMTDIKKDPIRLACLFYYPKGAIYGATDDNENLIHPIKDRYQLFKEHFPLTTYLECASFFLQKCEKSMRLSTESQKAAEKILKILRVGKPMSGRS